MEVHVDIFLGHVLTSARSDMEQQVHNTPTYSAGSYRLVGCFLLTGHYVSSVTRPSIRIEVTPVPD